MTDVNLKRLNIPKSNEITLGVLRRTLRGKRAEPGWIRENISDLVVDVQLEAYEDFQRHQRRAASMIANLLIRNLPGKPTKADVRKAARNEFPAINSFFLSLTQSRRSRAGDSFQVVMNDILQRLGYPFTPKPRLDGKPDFVMPSKQHYNKNPMDCIVLTLKTTLRERWRQVVTEGAKGTHFYLATIDRKLSDKELSAMKSKKVYVVVPADAQDECYTDHDNVLSFEEFIEDHLDYRMKLWKKHKVIAKRRGSWIYVAK